MLKKLKFIKVYNGTFIAVLILFLLIDVGIDMGYFESQRFENINDLNKPQEFFQSLVVMAIIIDVLVIAFFILFLINLVI